MAEDMVPDTPRARESLGEIGLTHFAPYLMNRIMGRYNAELSAAMRQLGLSTPKMRTLAVLAVVPGLTINELSVYSVIEQSTMSRTLEALEQAGLVRRVERESDARVREIYLTDAGRAVFDQIWPEMFGAYDEMFIGIGEAEKQAFITTLQKVLKNVRKHEI